MIDCVKTLSLRFISSSDKFGSRVTYNGFNNGCQSRVLNVVYGPSAHHVIPNQRNHTWVSRSHETSYPVYVTREHFPENTQIICVMKNITFCDARSELTSLGSESKRDTSRCAAPHRNQCGCIWSACGGSSLV